MHLSIIHINFLSSFIIYYILQAYLLPKIFYKAIAMEKKKKKKG